MLSPSWNSFPANVNFLFASSIVMSPHPDTQHVPIPRATTAAWDVIPPRTVRIPCADFIPVMSSGDVSRRTRITFSPLAAHSTASSAVNTILPQAAPGDAPSAFAIGVAAFSAAASNCGWRSVSRFLGSIIATASSSVLIPSSTRSQAILRAAWAVLLPLRVWSMNSLPCSTVNSMSCISL